MPAKFERAQMNIEEIANQFIAAINRHDIEAICRLMTEDHTFIDSCGDVHHGIEQMRQGWSEYFNMFPDYMIEAPEFVVSDDTIILLGRASGTYTADGTLRPENHWEIPAAWKAVIDGDKIKLWQIFADNAPIVEIMRKDAEDRKVV